MSWHKFPDEKPTPGIGLVVRDDRKQFQVAYFFEDLWYIKDYEERSLLEVADVVEFWFDLPAFPPEFDEEVAKKTSKKKKVRIPAYEALWKGEDEKNEDYV